MANVPTVEFAEESGPGEKSVNKQVELDSSKVSFGDRTGVDLPDGHTPGLKKYVYGSEDVTGKLVSDEGRLPGGGKVSKEEANKEEVEKAKTQDVETGKEEKATTTKSTSTSSTSSSKSTKSG